MAKHRSPYKGPLIGAVVLAALVAGGALYLGWPWWVAALLAANVVTALLYVSDKLAAKAGATRVPEIVLHLGELLGGSPAALAMQWAIRHKCSKKSYQIKFWIIVVLQVAVGGFLLYRRYGG